MKKIKSITEPIKFELRCRVFGCNNRAKYKLGNKEGTPSACYYVCEDCLRGIINTVPEEFKTVNSNNDLIENIEELKLKKSVLEKELSDLKNKYEPSEEATIKEIPKEISLEDIKNMDYKELQQYAKEIGISATGKHEELLERVLNELVINNG